ncbi:hypothetical protein PILCRDRAFT_816170 [Piloderma croceum F 1598]|uniref:Uncharacterized protein n=1 Tax=Piloderma croceum (strain F 1598) TaxID=765440 RepID=A0A0C3BIU3_PILCF|nr:hypothetical protein PILCRDRAFT_816170 [Piloderma croceum F 1598]
MRTCLSVLDRKRSHKAPSRKLNKRRHTDTEILLPCTGTLNFCKIRPSLEQKSCDADSGACKLGVT